MSPDYIRGLRDGVALAEEWLGGCVPTHILAAEAAKLPEADGIDWQARAELYRDKARENSREAENLESALAAMTERARVLEEALRPFADSPEGYPQHLKEHARRAAAVLTEKVAPDAPGGDK